MSWADQDGPDSSNPPDVGTAPGDLFVPRKEDVNENPANVVGIHDECAEERRRRFQARYTVDDVDVGDWVKKKFVDGGLGEHAWVKVTGKSGARLFGTLDNDMVLVKNAKYGDSVELDFSEVEEICAEDD